MLNQLFSSIPQAHNRGTPSTGWMRPSAVTTTISVVCGIDDGYAMPLATMMQSLFQHLSADCQIHLFVIDAGIQPENRAKIAASLATVPCQITWIQPSEAIVARMKTMMVSAHITPAAYYRLLMAELLPAALDKVIYLDCDLMVMGDLKNLWQTPLGSHHLLAVQDVGVGQVSSLYGLSNYAELGIPPETKYFNSGVMVVNLDQWREHQIGWRLIHYLETNPDAIRLHDQDALNAVLFDKWGELHPAWNQQYHIFRFRSWRQPPFLSKFRAWQPSPLPQEIYEQTLRHPKVVHFTYYFKPWVVYFHPYRRAFYRYVDRTAWLGWRYPWWRATIAFYQRASRYLHIKLVNRRKNLRLLKQHS